MIDLLCEQRSLNVRTSRTTGFYSGVLVRFAPCCFTSVNALSASSSKIYSHAATGKDFVKVLGEPDRKGGGAGPSSGSIGIWCEWSKDGLMVEFGGDEARGPQAWERGKDEVWKVITLFPPTTE